MLSLLTDGKHNGIERTLVRQMLSCRERWPHRENDFKELLFLRMVNHDADFFRTLIVEIEFIQGGSVDYRPQAAAVLRGWLHLREATGDFPTANELFEYVRLNEKACKKWKRFDDDGRNDPRLSYMRILRFIRRDLDLFLKPEKPGRKRKLRK